MEITLTLGEMIWLLVAIMLIVLIVFLIVFIGKANKTLKKVDGVLDDAKVITSSAAEKVEKVDGMIEDCVDTVNAFAASLKGKKGIISTIGSVASCCASLVGLSNNKEEK